MDEIAKKKRSIAILKKVIVFFIIIPTVPVLIYISLILSASRQSHGITVDERFKLSSSIKSPYKDTLKGSYQYSFAFCGDPHLREESDGCFSDLDEAIRSNRMIFVIFGGDLTFLGKDTEYKNFVDHVNALTVPSYPVLGNHDLYNSGWSSYQKYFGPSSYSFYGGNAKFIVIDTASGDIGEEQMEWIKKELKTNKQPLLFVISHMPIYGGSHSFYAFPKGEERTELIELFEKYEVDYVLEGHYHGFVNIMVNGVRYITSGAFSDGLLDEGDRHFLMFRIYGPNVSIEKIPVKTDKEVYYRDGEV